MTDTLANIFVWAEDHVRLFQVASGLVAIAIGGGGFFLGWLLRHQRALRERQDYRLSWMIRRSSLRLIC